MYIYGYKCIFTKTSHVFALISMKNDKYLEGSLVKYLIFGVVHIAARVVNFVVNFVVLRLQTDWAYLVPCRSHQVVTGFFYFFIFHDRPG